MDKKLEVYKRKKSDVGSCNFCNRQHKEVVQIKGDKTLTCRMCCYCLDELIEATSVSFIRPKKPSESLVHPATIFVEVKQSEDTIGWWYNNVKDSLTVRDCISRDELRDLKSNIEYKHTEFFVVDNGEHIGNVILKSHVINH
jgi:hypothetical protein